MSGDKGFVYKVERFNLLSGKLWAFVGTLAILVLIALNYFNIFSPSLLGFLPRKVVQVSVPTNNIGFASEKLGYTIGVRGDDHAVLLDALNRLGFLGKKQSASEQAITTVLVLLANNRSSMVDFTDEKRGVLFSYSKVFSKDSVLIKIYLDDETLQKDTAQEEVGKALGFIFDTMLDGESPSKEKLSILEEIKNNIILTKDEQLIRTKPSITPIKVIENKSTQ
jgi:hypothetical protein